MAITDKFMHASSGTRPEPTTLTAQKSLGASTLTADDLTGWATDTPTSFVLFQLDTMGAEIAGTRSDWVGIVVGNTITQLTLTAGTDDTYPAGSAVIAAATAEWGDRVVDGVLVSHEQDGTLKSNIVSTSKIADGAITGPKLATSAITLGYAERTSNFSTSSTSDTDITDLSVTVTVPSGGRRVKITGFVGTITNNSGGNVVTLKIKEGTTTLNTSRANTPNLENTSIASPIASFVPTAGSHTYKLSIANDVATSVTLSASSTSPIFILAELI